MIHFGFAPCGDFIAVDTVSHAAERGYKGSSYWRNAKRDPAATAADMVATLDALRTEFPDMPSHQPAVWDANYAALANLIGEREGRG